MSKPECRDNHGEMKPTGEYTKDGKQCYKCSCSGCSYKTTWWSVSDYKLHLIASRYGLLLDTLKKLRYKIKEKYYLTSVRDITDKQYDDFLTDYTDHSAE